MEWTDEEWQAFQGHTWTERRIVHVKGRLFADLMNISNPAELRDAQTVESPENLYPIVARIVYRDNVEYSSVHASKEIAQRTKGWTGVGWLKETQQ